MTGNKKQFIWFNIIISVLFFLLCFLLYKNISYPLLWNDEAETAMNAKQILKYGYPKGHDEKNTIFLPDDATWIGYKASCDANITIPWASYYFAVIGVFIANHVDDIYFKTALVRIPFVTIGLLGLIIFIFALRNFFPKRITYKSFIAAFLFLELFSVSLCLHIREARYYSMVIFITACFFYVFTNYLILSRFTYRKYFMLMVLILFSAYQINFVTCLAFCLTLGLHQVWYSVSIIFLEFTDRKKIAVSILSLFQSLFRNLLPVLVSLVLIIPFVVFFESFSTASRADIHYGFNFEIYTQHLHRIIYVFSSQEFLIPVLFIKSMRVIIWFYRRINSNRKINPSISQIHFKQLSFFITLFFICFCVVVSRLPIFYTRYFIVLQPVLVLIMLIDFVIVFDFISFSFSGSEKILLHAAVIVIPIIIFLSNPGQKIFYMKEYLYQLTNQYKGPLDYLIPFIKDKYPEPDTLILATNYEELSYIYYLNCKVILGYTNKNLKDDLQYRPDIIIFRKEWKHDPTLYKNLLKKASYTRMTFPVYDSYVNNIAELDFAIAHQFKTRFTETESEKTDVYFQTK